MFLSPRSESGAQPSTKACREKIRRDKLNERYLLLINCILFHGLIFLVSALCSYN
jgi:hypothetical protein